MRKLMVGTAALVLFLTACGSDEPPASSPKLPEVSFPSDLPQISIPELSMPEITMPEISMPEISVAEPTLPEVSMPVMATDGEAAAGEGDWMAAFADEITRAQDTAAAFREAAGTYRPGDDGAAVAEAGQTLYTALSDLHQDIIASEYSTGSALLIPPKMSMVLTPVNNTGSCQFSDDCSDLLTKALAAMDAAETEIGFAL